MLSGETSNLPFALQVIVDSTVRTSIAGGFLGSVLVTSVVTFSSSATTVSAPCLVIDLTVTTISLGSIGISRLSRGSGGCGGAIGVYVHSLPSASGMNLAPQADGALAFGPVYLTWIGAACTT